jgi:tetratricopeptide (TPR) repeat protein
VTRRAYAALALGATLYSTAVLAQPGASQPAPPPSQPTPVRNEPGPTGPGLGAPRAPVSTAPITLDAKELEQLKDNEAEYDRFIQAAAENDARMRSIAKHEYDTRTGDLDKRYSDRIAKTEADRIKRHSDTVALLEKFLVNHPNHETFTPDAMFRLADLYLDQADEELDAKLSAQEKQLKDAAATGSGDTGGSGDSAALMADYSKSLDLWEQILKKFPTYRQTPSTLYLLAYYGKTRDERRSLQTFLALACSNKYKWDGTPEPVPTRAEAIKRAEGKTLRDPYADCQPYPGAETELVRHAWVRGIADYHFLVPGEIDEAIAAYLKVADTGQDSKLYAESLYKLAWSYYKRDFLEDSIKRFDASIKLYDSVVAAGGQPSLELRDESLQYIAVAFTDPWNGETDTNAPLAFDRATAFYKGRENEPHVRDVWVALGKAFADLQAWDQAVASYKIAIGPPWELDPHAPTVYQEIVNVYEAKGDKLAADAAAADLALRYAPGTSWFVANEHDREAMESQRRISERALYVAAINTKTAAKNMRLDYENSSKKDPQAKADYLAMYAKSVELFRSFVSAYPDSDQTYEFNYQTGEALFFSEHYMEAAQSYRWVRDHKDISEVHYLDAARSVVNSYEAERDHEIADGRLPPLRPPTAAELRAMPQPLTPQPIPEIYLQLQQEYDNYQQHVPDPAVAPGQGNNAAVISLVYLHIDDAISRFQKVVDQFCHSPPPDPKSPPYAAKAKDGLLSIYEATGNLDAFEATNKAFITNGCGDKSSIDLAISQNRSLNFQRATELFRKQDYVPAGDAFYKFYKTAPQTDSDLPTALYNSAVSYKLGDRPKTAISLFKEFTANPKKEYRESAYYLDAVRLTAASYQAAFDYDNAVATYLQLYDVAKRAKKTGLKPPPPLPGEKPITLEELGLTALYNAAFAAELNRDFKKSIDLYQQYGRVEPDRRKQDRALWEIASIYKQSGDVADMTDTLDRWRRLYGKDPGNEDDYVQGFYDTGVIYKRKGRNADAAKLGQATIDAWKARGKIPKGRGAKLAGEWELQFAEDYYAKNFEPYEIKKAAATVPQLNQQRADLDKVRKATEEKYKALDDYQIVEYSMGALVRFGDIQYGYGRKLSDAPVPTPIQNASNPDVLAKYESDRDKALAKYLDEAKQDWDQVDQTGRQNGISNRWTQAAREDLGREFPQQYKSLHQELVQGTDAP